MLLRDVLLIFFRIKSLWLDYGILVEMAVTLPLRYTGASAGPSARQVVHWCGKSEAHSGARNTQGRSIQRVATLET